MTPAGPCTRCGKAMTAACRGCLGLLQSAQIPTATPCAGCLDSASGVQRRDGRVRDLMPFARLLQSLLLGMALFVASTGVASADNCSNVPDTKKCAAAINAAAAVAALVAGAVAAGLIPKVKGEGGEKLSPECERELQSLSDAIKTAYETLAELQVARQGAFQSFAQANLGAAQLREQAKNIVERSRNGDYDWQSAMDNTASLPTGVDDLLAWGNTATAAGIGGSAGEWAIRGGYFKTAFSAIGRQQMLVQAAQLKDDANMARELARQTKNLLYMAGRGGESEAQIARTTAALNAARTEAAALASRAAAMEAQALKAGSNAAAATGLGMASSTLTYLGKGLGVYSVLSTAISMNASRSRSDGLMVAGILQARAAAALGDATRLENILNDLTQRSEFQQMRVINAVSAYNQRAIQCHAVLIPAAALGQLSKGFNPVQALDDPLVAGWEELPALQGPPKPQGPQRPYDANCATYLQDVETYRAALNAIRMPPRPGMWYRRLRDIDVTLPVLETALGRAEAGFRRSLYWQVGTGSMSAGTSIAALASCVAPPVAVALGIASLVSGLISSSATPEEVVVIYVGKLAQSRDLALQKRAAASAQADREERELAEKTATLLTQFQQLNIAYSNCDGMIKNWPVAPEPDNLPSIDKFTPGSVRRIEEILSW